MQRQITIFGFQPLLNLIFTAGAEHSTRRLHLIAVPGATRTLCDANEPVADDEC